MKAKANPSFMRQEQSHGANSGKIYQSRGGAGRFELRTVVHEQEASNYFG